MSEKACPGDRRLRRSPSPPVEGPPTRKDTSGASRRSSSRNSRLGIVIPTLDEAADLERCLESAKAVTETVIVSDGGSRDSTVAIAKAHGVEIVTGAPGRGSQLNRGARLAIERGAGTLLFLHADTLLPDEAERSVRKAIEGGAPGGGFLVRFDVDERLFDLGSWIVNRRTHLLRAPLGDQAQFVSVGAYQRLGGFEEWAILEDLNFIRRLRREGRIAVVGPPVETAARRFKVRGVVRTVATNWLIFALYAVGVSADRLARLYPSLR